MKDKENIKNINKLSVSYIMLMGLNGQILVKNNPFLTYLMFNMLMSGYDEKFNGNDELNRIVYLVDVEDGIEKKINIIPNELLHLMIEETYIMYKKLDELSTLVDPQINEQIISYLDDKEEFINEIITNFKRSLVFILLNFKSMNKSYNNIKIDILSNELKEVIKIEDYDNAIIYRDKINETKERLKKITE